MIVSVVTRFPHGTGNSGRLRTNDRREAVRGLVPVCREWDPPAVLLRKARESVVRRFPRENPSRTERNSPPIAGRRTPFTDANWMRFRRSEKHEHGVRV